MQLLLSNPTRKKKRKSKSKSKRRQAKRRVFRRTGRTRAASSARKVPTMARKATRRRRRSNRRSTRRRSSSSGSRSRGFINTSLLMTGAGVAGGLIAAPYVSRFIPAQMAANPFVVPAVKAGAGLAVAAFGKKFNPALATALAAGLIGSAVLDLAVAFRGTAGGNAPAGVKGYIGDIVSAEAGDYMMEDGATVSGYLTDEGEVLGGDGSVVGEIDLADAAYD